MKRIFGWILTIFGGLCYGCGVIFCMAILTTESIIFMRRIFMLIVSIVFTVISRMLFHKGKELKYKKTDIYELDKEMKLKYEKTDIYQKLNKLSKGQRQVFIESLSLYGDSNEILAYINNMTVLCPEDSGFLGVSPEIRFDNRFLVCCRGKDIEVYPTDTITGFFFAFSLDEHLDDPEDKDCHVFFYYKKGKESKFCFKFLDKRYAVRVFQAFNQYTSSFETGISLMDKELIQEYEMDTQGLALKREKILYQDILSCSIRYRSSVEEPDSYGLVIYLRDGSHRILSPYCLTEKSASICYCLAKTIQHFAPHLQYQLI